MLTTIRNALIMSAVALSMATALSVPSAEASDKRETKTLKQSPIGDGCKIKERKAKPDLLRGRIEHSDRVPSLDEKYAPGKHFDGFPAEIEPTTESWVQIPSWLAGEHSTNKSVVKAVLNFRTGERSYHNQSELSRNTFRYGHQIDAHGNIWHLNKLPYRGLYDKGDYIQYGKTEINKFEKTGDTLFVRESSGPSIRVVKSTGVIQATAYLESIEKYHFDGKEVIIESSTKSFDDKGEPVELNLREVRATLVIPFMADPSTEDSFRRFMRQPEQPAGKDELQNTSSPSAPKSSAK